MIVPYDEKFDAKIEAAAALILKHFPEENSEKAKDKARLTLLAAMAVEVGQSQASI